jgi:hypothetical protein
MKRKSIATCCGGIGAYICTISMLLATIIGVTGTGLSVARSMSGMSGNAQAGGLWIVINAINFLGQPLLIASIALILYGMKGFGKLPLAIAAVGGFLLYAGMYLLNMLVPMIAISSVILAGAYGTAYGPLMRKHKSPRELSKT